MLGRKIEIFNFSILKKRPRIFKESFLLGRIIKIFISSNLPSCLGHFLQFIIVSKINQGSCLGCLGGDDAPAILGHNNFIFPKRVVKSHDKAPFFLRLDLNIGRMKA